MEIPREQIWLHAAQWRSTKAVCTYYMSDPVTGEYSPADMCHLRNSKSVRAASERAMSYIQFREYLLRVLRQMRLVNAFTSQAESCILLHSVQTHRSCTRTYSVHKYVHKYVPRIIRSPCALGRPSC